MTVPQFDRGPSVELLRMYNKLKARVEYLETREPISEDSINNTTDFFNGTFVESFDARTSSDGVTVTMSLEKSGGGDLSMRFSDGVTTLDCTPAQTIELTAGTDAAPQDNWIYILQSTKVLTKSTTGWPSQSVEHIKVAYFFVPSAATVNDDSGTFVNQNWNDERAGTTGYGHLAHMGEKIRLGIGSTYLSGLGITVTIQNSPSEVYLATDSGLILQMHEQTIDALDMQAGDDAHIINDSVSAYKKTNDLGTDITADANGATLNNRYFNLFVAISANKGGEYSPLLINLPEGSYTSLSDALADPSDYNVTTLPDAFNKDSSNGVALYLLTFRKTPAGGGTWTLENTEDLRNANTLGGGGSVSPQTDFSDGTFSIFNTTDPTKIAEFDASGITTATTRTYDFPNASGTFTLLEVSQTFSGDKAFQDNIKALFGTSGDASIFYDGTDMYIDSREVGVGNLYINESAGIVTVGGDSNTLAAQKFNVRGSMLISEETGAVQVRFGSFDAGAANSGRILANRARGSDTTPTAVQANDALFKFNAFGYGATGFSANAKARMEYYASENWTDAAQGTYIEFFTTEAGSTTVRERLHINDETVFNEPGADMDFRIEGDSLAYMFYTDASAATENIALLTTAAPNWQSMDRGIFLGNVSNAPTGNPSGGGFLYSSAGALTWRGSGGTITTIAPAEPHCPVCGTDYMLQWVNEKYGHLAVCINCLTLELGDRPYIIRSD